MADYRLDCCGGFPTHKDGCRAVAEAPARKAAKTERDAVLDKLYAKYGELLALAERTSHNTRMAYHDKADGLLMGIRIVEGKDPEE